MPIEESFTKSLFYGAIPEEMVLPFPEPTAADRDHAALLVDRMRGLSPVLDAARSDREATLSPEALQGLRGSGAFGLGIPQSFGGAGLPLTGQARVLQELGALDGSAAVTVLVHGMLSANAVLLFGTDAQRSRWLPAMARGESVGCFALTERGAGSDPGGLRTQATLRPGGVWTLDGEKVWVTNGGIAELAVVIARTTERTARAAQAHGLRAGARRRLHHATLGPRSSASGARRPRRWSSQACGSPPTDCSGTWARATASRWRCSPGAASASRRSAWGPRASSRA